jgi:hypothetical protein
MRGCRPNRLRTEENMRPTTATDDKVFDFQALLHPGTVFEHPKDVVAHACLTLAEKRAILASWASDASAIASCPALRAPEGLKAPVSIDAIMEALCELDGGPRQAASRNAVFPRRGRWRPEEDPMEDIRLPRRDRPSRAPLGESPATGREVLEQRQKQALPYASGAHGRCEGHPGHRQTRSRSKRQDCPRINEKARIS